MSQCWVVRSVERVGQLTPQEWATLASAGRRLELAPHQRFSWGKAPGVVLVDRGEVRLTSQGIHCRQVACLCGGDMAGTMRPIPCQLDATCSSTLYTFAHEEWLATLRRVPHVMQKLLGGMAQAAMAHEQQLTVESS